MAPCLQFNYGVRCSCLSLPCRPTLCFSCDLFCSSVHRHRPANLFTIFAHSTRASPASSVPQHSAPFQSFLAAYPLHAFAGFGASLVARANLPRLADSLLPRIGDHLPVHATLSFAWLSALLNLDFTRACECALTAYRARLLLNPNLNPNPNPNPNLNPNSWRSTPAAVRRWRRAYHSVRIRI